MPKKDVEEEINIFKNKLKNIESLSKENELKLKQLENQKKLLKKIYFL